MATKATGAMAVPAAMPGAAGEGATVEGVPSSDLRVDGPDRPSGARACGPANTGCGSAT